MTNGKNVAKRVHAPWKNYATGETAESTLVINPTASGVRCSPRLHPDIGRSRGERDVASRDVPRTAGADDAPAGAPRSASCAQSRRSRDRRPADPLRG